MRPSIALLAVVLLAAGCKRHRAADAGVPGPTVEAEETPDAAPIVTVTAGAAVVLPSEKPAVAAPAAVDAGIADAGERDAGAEDSGLDAGPAVVWTTLPNNERDDAGVSDFVKMGVGGRLQLKFEGPIVGTICDGKIVEPVANGMNMELVAASPGTTHCVFKIFSANLPGRYFEITVVP